MAQLSLVVLFLAVCVCQITSGLGEQTSEQHIKDIVTSFHSKCGECDDQANKVTGRTGKDDICDAFFTFKGCMILHCFSESSGSQMTLAKEICDGASVIHVSILVLLMAAIMHCIL